MLRVHDFRMELNGIKTLCRVLHRRDRTDRRMRRQGKSRRHSADIVGMAHPADVLFRNPHKEERIPPRDVHLCSAVLARRRGLNRSAQQISHELRPIADAKHGNPHGKEFLRRRHRLRAVYTVRSSRQDDAARRKRTNLSE